MRILKIAAVALAFSPLPAGASGREAGDAAEGARMHDQIVAHFGGVYDEHPVADYVSDLGHRLAAHSDQADEDWTFTVLDTPVVNAFANPGGYIYVTRGLLALADDEAQLAGVLGHEIGHVTENHFAERNEQGAKAGIGLVVGAVIGGLWNGKEGVRDALETGSKLAIGYVAGHSREQEYEADTEGVRLLVRAGYDPRAQADFLDALAGQYALDAQLRGREYNPGRVDFFASHPAPDARVRRALRTADRESDGTTYRGEDAYLDAIDGMIYGDTPSQGFVRGHRFEHPEMRFAYEVPEGFTILNSDRMVVATGPGDAEFILDGGRAPSGRLDRFIAREWAPVVARGREAGALFDLRQIEVDGIEGATGFMQVHYKGELRMVQLTVFRIDRRLFRFQGISRLDDTVTREALDQAILSFEQLSEAEAAALSPHRIRIHEAGPGDSLDSLAATLPMASLQVERLRLMNGYGDGEVLRTGDRVKLIGE